MRYLILILMTITFSSFANEYDPDSRLQSLFTTPQERSQLDKLRASGKYHANTIAADNTFVRQPVTLQMQGVLIQGKRKPVAFINDQNTSRSVTLDNNIRVDIKKLKPGDYSVPIRINSQAVTLRPGQQWDESSRQIKDNYLIKQSKQKTSGLDTATGTDIMQ